MQQRETANLGLREQLVNYIPMAHKNLMLGSNEKDVEELLWFSLGLGLIYLSFNPSPVISALRWPKVKQMQLLRATKDMEMALEALQQNLEFSFPVGIQYHF